MAAVADTTIEQPRVHRVVFWFNRASVAPHDNRLHAAGSLQIALAERLQCALTVSHVLFVGIMLAFIAILVGVHAQAQGFGR